MRVPFSLTRQIDEAWLRHARARRRSCTRWRPTSASAPASAAISGALLYGGGVIVVQPRARRRSVRPRRDRRRAPGGGADRPGGD